MIHAFEKKCKNVAEVGLMLDVGANMGYYGLQALASGCEVLLFDLQIGCQNFITNSLVLNGFAHTGRMVPFGVGSVESTVRVAEGTCDGRYPVQAHEEAIYDPKDGKETFTQPLSRFIANDQKIAIMKIDTEGNENHVLQGSIEYFRRNLVSHVIVEITPGHPAFWEGSNTTIDEIASTFREIAEFGYNMVSLHDFTICDSPDSVEKYIRVGHKGETDSSTPFKQTDMWLSLKSEEGDLRETVKAMKAAAMNTPIEFLETARLW